MNLILKEREIVIRWTHGPSSFFETFVSGYGMQLIKCAYCRWLHLGSNKRLPVLLSSLCGEWSEMSSLKGWLQAHPKAVLLHHTWEVLAMWTPELGMTNSEGNSIREIYRCSFFFFIHSSRILVLVLNKSWRNESFTCSFSLLLKMLLKSASVHKDK